MSIKKRSKLQPCPLAQLRKICAVGRAALNTGLIGEGWHTVSFDVRHGRDGGVTLTSDKMSLDGFTIRRTFGPR